MTATLERPTALHHDVDSRITGGHVEEIHTVVNATPSPIDHLSAAQVEELGRELDAIRREAMDSCGEAEAAYIRRVIAARRYLELGSRAVLLFSRNPVAWVAGTAGLSVAKILDNMEIGHNIMHGQWDWMRDPKIHSSTWEWDTVSPSEHWKHSHNEIHHTYTNVVGKDNDLGYGIMRVDDAQKWYPVYLAQPLLNLVNATFFEYGIAAYDLELGKNWRTRKTDPAFRAEMKKVTNKIKRQALRDYVLWPALSGPGFLPSLAANVTANVVRNYWTHSVIMCGHFPAGVETFTKTSIEGETRGEWYLRQMLGSANISGGRAMHIMTGYLSHQIEHHLYPDMPSIKLAEVQPKVQAVFERYGLRYVEGPLVTQVASAWAEIWRLSRPNATSSAQTFRILATQGIKGLKKRARATRHVYA